nr:MAG TPA: hypothetical protein [Caudoviricetes sp.]
MFLYFLIMRLLYIAKSLMSISFLLILRFFY